MNRSLLFSIFLVATTATAGAAGDLEEQYGKANQLWQDGNVVPAMKALKPVADAGHAKAQALYGLALDQADDDVEAARYYKLAADQNDPDGTYGLATLLLTGDGGEKDPKKALELYVRSAELGHRYAPVIVSTGYAQDDWGLGEAAKDSAAAWEWTKKAATLDDVDAMVRLEGAYRNGGTHVKQDIAAADALQKRLIKIQGLENAKKRRQRR